MAKKKGLCRNEECVSFNQPVEVDELDFVCPECGEPLFPIDGGGIGTDTKNKKWIKYAGIGVAAVAILGGVGYGVSTLLGGSSTPKEIQLNHMTKELKVGDKDTLMAKTDIENFKGTFIWKNSKGGSVKVTDGIVTAEKEGEGIVRVTIEGVDGVKAECKYKVVKPKKPEGPNEGPGGTTPDPKTTLQSLTANKSSVSLTVGGSEQLTATKTPAEATAEIAWASNNSKVATVDKNGKVTAKSAGTAVVTAVAVDKTASVVVTVAEKTKTGGGPTTPPVDHGNGVGTVNLGYGVYYGERKNGKPHGHGTITYKKTHRIISSKDYVAEPGDKFEGEFRNGQVSGGMGYWKHQGDIIAVKP